MEERLISEYIGENADKIKKGQANWAAGLLGLFFGPIWFFYRKSYLLGFAFFVLSYFVGSLANAINFKQASYIMFFIYLFTANNLYLWDVKRKVNKIMSSGDMSEEELISAVRKKGGTSVIATVIYAIAFVAFIAIYFVLIYYLALNTIMAM